ncbi:MAG: AbrB/MazE/SpoVT family DNA-binding domain-containing protein [Candidatus Anammoxibacter sp.]
MKTLQVDKNGVLVLPKTLRAIFKSTDKLAWFAEGDTLIIKRISPPKLSKITGRSKEKPMPLKEIVKEVHAHRKEKINK